MQFRYELHTHGAFDPVASTLAGLAAGQWVELHPVVARSSAPQKQFIKVLGRGVVPLQMKPAEDGRGLIVRLLNAANTAVTAQIHLPGLVPCRAWLSSPLEERGRKLECVGGSVCITLAGRAVASLRIDRNSIPLAGRNLS